MSYLSAVDHLYALGHELAPALAPTLSPDATPVPRRKFDLAHMRALMVALGDPQTTFPAILIAGTNGKGSTASTLASILTAAGYRTALYTSPHLVRVNERIQIDGIEIPDEDFARLYFQVDDAANRLVATGALPHHPSFFEVLTALAFLYFAEQKIDIAILEVGLGGRLDATNIVDPLLSIITDIALDHQDYLGDTIAEITREKAGILRPNGILITLPQHPEANQTIGEAAATLNLTAISAASFIPPPTPPSDREPGAPRPASGTWVSEAATRHVISTGTAGSPTNFFVGVQAQRSGETPVSPLEASPNQNEVRTNQNEVVILREAEDLLLSSVLPPNRYTLNLDNQPLEVNSPLHGQHQQRNIALAITAAIALRNENSYKLSPKSNQTSYKITNASIEAGIRNTRWPGRLELIPGNPPILLDVAHNPAGAWTLRAAIAQLPAAQPRTLIFSCLRDKSLKEMTQILFPLFDSTSGDPERVHDRIFLAPIDNPRASTLEDLLSAAHALDVPAHAAPHLTAALAEARAATPPDGLIIATGSVYLVGEIRRLALRHEGSPA